MANIARVAFLVCTRDRWLSLLDCLDGIAKQDPVPGVAVEIVVSDNNDASIADRLREHHPRIHYIHEPRRGYSNVRNAAIARGLEATAADVFIFIDDDLRPLPDLLAAHIATLSETGADVSGGHYQGSKTFASGTRMRKVPTFNVAFRRWIAEAVRFCPEANLLGCEDHEYFGDAARVGAQMVRCPKALVTAATAPDDPASAPRDGWLLHRVGSRNTIHLARKRRGLGSALYAYVSLYAPRLPRSAALYALAKATGSAAHAAKARENWIIHKGAIEGFYLPGLDREFAKRSIVAPVMDEATRG